MLPQCLMHFLQEPVYKITLSTAMFKSSAKIVSEFVVWYIFVRSLLTCVLSLVMHFCKQHNIQGYECAYWTEGSEFLSSVGRVVATVGGAWRGRPALTISARHNQKKKRFPPGTKFFFFFFFFSAWHYVS